MKALKIGIIAVVAIIAVTLITLRITGLEPQYLDLNQLRAHHMIARPGLWLKGQLVTVPVTDWSFVNDVKDPGRSLNTILVETRTPYLIPHSVRVVPHVRNGQLFIQSHQDRMDRKFPYEICQQSTRAEFRGPCPRGLSLNASLLKHNSTDFQHRGALSLCNVFACGMRQTETLRNQHIMRLTQQIGGAGTERLCQI